MEIPKATPYRVEQKTPIRKFEVEETGRVKMTETVTTTVYFEAREFITFKRSFDESRRQLSEQLGKEAQEKIKEEIVKIEKQLKTIDPLISEVEAKAKIHYEKLKRDSEVKRLREAISKDTKGKEKYISLVWENMGVAQRVRFSAKEQKVIFKAIAKSKRG